MVGSGSGYGSDCDRGAQIGNYTETLPQQANAKEVEVVPTGSCVTVIFSTCRVHWFTVPVQSTTTDYLVVY